MNGFLVDTLAATKLPFHVQMMSLLYRIARVVDEDNREEYLVFVVVSQFTFTARPKQVFLVVGILSVQPTPSLKQTFLSYLHPKKNSFSLQQTKCPSLTPNCE